MAFCDIHTHILPQVDDGAHTPEAALQMLQNAVNSDVSTLVVTPHCCSPSMSNLYNPALEAQFQQLKEAAAHIPVQLLLGAEVRVTEQLIPLLQEGLLPTINSSRYLLTEFPADFPGLLFPRVLEQLLENGVIPVVAHPERYDALLAEPLLAREWVKLGCRLQITGGSITGQFGGRVRKTSEKLLDAELVCCVASDAHDTQKRNNNLKSVYDYLSTHYSKDYADILLTKNPLAICNNQAL